MYMIWHWMGRKRMWVIRNWVMGISKKMKRVEGRS